MAKLRLVMAHRRQGGGGLETRPTEDEGERWGRWEADRVADGEDNSNAKHATALIDAAPFDDDALWQYFGALTPTQLRKCWIACITDATFSAIQNGRGLGSIVRALVVVGERLHKVDCSAWEDTVMAVKSEVWGGLGTAKRKQDSAVESLGPARVSIPTPSHVVDGMAGPGEAKREIAGVTIGRGVPPPAKGGRGGSRAPDKWTLAILALRVGEHIVVPKSAGIKRSAMSVRLATLKKRGELAVLLRSWETEDGSIVIHAHAAAKGA